MTEGQRIEQTLKRWGLKTVALGRKPEHGGTGRLPARPIARREIRHGRRARRMEDAAA